MSEKIHSIHEKTPCQTMEDLNTLTKHHQMIANKTREALNEKINKIDARVRFAKNNDRFDRLQMLLEITEGWEEDEDTPLF